jgi:thioesterase domain-containing protein
MVPSAAVQLEHLPLTPNGKVNRRALPEPDLAHVESGPAVAARDALEAMLVKTWQRVLGVPTIGVTDNFFDLGGHSLLAARLLSEVERLTGREVPLSTLFRGATVESLARVLREGSELSPDPLVMEIQTATTELPFFGVASPGVESLGFILLARHMGPEQAVYKLQASAPIVEGRPFTKEELHSMAKEYVAAMRSVQPEGPYCFGGMCEGAQIATQMAIELEAQGQEVGFVAIFDTWVIENSQRRGLWFLYYYKQRLAQLRRRGLAAQLPTLKKAAVRSLKNLVRRQGPPMRGDWEKAYWPGDDSRESQFQGRVLLFRRPKQPFYYVDDPAMGWKRRTQGEVEIHMVDFKHLEILREPYVGILGNKLAECMRRLRAERAAVPADSVAESGSVSAIAASGAKVP